MSTLPRAIGSLLLAGLLLAACETPEGDTLSDNQLGGTPGGDDGVDELDPDVGETDPDVGETDPAGNGTDESQRGDDFEGDLPTDADLTSRPSPLGTHLVDGHGRTLYVFLQDPAGERTCTGECLETWPIFSTGDELPTVDGEVREELVGTTAGDLQVTYNDQPLYYYDGDDTVGDVNGQGRNGEWFVVDAEGTPVEQELD